MLEQLLKGGKHSVTTLTRADSKSTFPDGVNVVRVNYDDEQALVSALEGQQFLVITLAITAPPDTHSKIVRAAAKAGVPYIMPNVYSSDIIANEKLGNETMMGPVLRPLITEIEELGVSAYVLLVTSLWYQFGLTMGPEFLGFDLKSRKVTLYDDGKTAIQSSTWPQTGRAVASLLSLKELPEDENDTSATLSQFKNKPVYISSFRVSQRDILDSVQRVTGTTDGDWDIGYEATPERYQKGLKVMQQGDMRGHAMAMYARVFYPSGGGDYGAKLHNDVLGLETEDLDAATKVAVEMSKGGMMGGP